MCFMAQEAVLLARTGEIGGNRVVAIAAAVKGKLLHRKMRELMAGNARSHPCGLGRLNNLGVTRGAEIICIYTA